MSRFNIYQDNNWNLKETEKKIERSTQRYNINVTYPEYSLAERSLDIFNVFISGKIMDYVQNFTNIAEEMVLPDGVKSELKGEFSTYTANKRFITVKFDFYTYFGGAHPAHEILTVTFDTATDTIIALSDFFRDNSNYLERLSMLVEEALFEKYPDLNFAFNSPAYRKGFAPKEENFTHWALTDEGLIIFFPEYQVAPYAAGTLDVEIPYTDIADITK